MCAVYSSGSIECGYSDTGTLYKNEWIQSRNNISFPILEGSYQIITCNIKNCHKFIGMSEKCNKQIETRDWSVYSKKCVGIIGNDAINYFGTDDLLQVSIDNYMYIFSYSDKYNKINAFYKFFSNMGEIFLSQRRVLLSEIDFMLQVFFKSGIFNRHAYDDKQIGLISERHVFELLKNLFKRSNGEHLKYIRYIHSKIKTNTSKETYIKIANLVNKIYKKINVEIKANKKKYSLDSNNPRDREFIYRAKSMFDENYIFSGIDIKNEYPYIYNELFSIAERLKEKQHISDDYYSILSRAEKLYINNVPYFAIRDLDCGEIIKEDNTKELVDIDTVDLEFIGYNKEKIIHKHSDCTADNPFELLNKYNVHKINRNTVTIFIPFNVKKPTPQSISLIGANDFLPKHVLTNGR